MPFTDFSTKIFPSRIKIGDDTSPNYPLHIIGEGNDSSTKSLQIDDLSGDTRLFFEDDGKLNVYNSLDANINDDGIQIKSNDDNLGIYGSRSINLKYSNNNEAWVVSTVNVGSEVQIRSINNQKFFINGEKTQTFTITNGAISSKRHLVRRLQDANNNGDSYNSYDLDLQSNYNDGSKTFTHNHFRRVQDSASSEGGRLNITTDDGALDVNFMDTGEVGIGTTTPNSTLDVVGSTGAEIQTVTSDYTATTSDHTILGNASGGTLPIALPAPSNVERIKYNIKKIDSSSNNVDITVVDGSNIDGDTTQSITGQYDAITLHCDGTQYWIL